MASKSAGKPLRLLEGHTTAARAAVEIGRLRGPAVKGGNRFFAAHGRLVHRTVAEINQFLRMAECEARILSGVSRIRGRRGIAAPERSGECPVLNRSCPGPITDFLELAIPAGLRQPDF